MEVIKKLRLWRIFKSLTIRIFAIIFFIALVSCVVIKSAIIANYEARAVDVKQNEVQTQLRILANHLITYNYLENPSSDVVNAEIVMLSNLYDGRVLIINSDLKVVADSYNLSVGKIVISEEVIKTLKNGNDGVTVQYDSENSFLELTTPIIETSALREGDRFNLNSRQLVRGVMLTSVSTSAIAQTKDILANRADLIQMIVIIVILFFAAFASNILIRPFERITKAINEIKAGLKNDPISVPDYLETEHITDAFNKLQARMKIIDDSRQEFVSNVSHELKTPITSMKVLADTLLAGENVSVDTYKEFMRDISEEIDRENQIINDLLTLVKMENSASITDVKPMNINDLTEIVLKRLRPIARQHDIELTMESTREITAEIDEVKMSIIIMNLVENGIKYNHEGGFVRVKLDADHQNFTIEISDSGIGIPEDSVDRLFERFYRVDKSRYREKNRMGDIGGTGLGLSVVRQLVLMHRGEISVSSVEGSGTVFTIRIPLKFKP